MPPTVAFAPVQPTDGDGRVGAALSHIGEATQPRSCPVILNQAADLPNFPVGNRGSGYGTLRQQGGTRERRGARERGRAGLLPRAHDVPRLAAADYRVRAYDPIDPRNSCRASHARAP